MSCAINGPAISSRAKVGRTFGSMKDGPHMATRCGWRSVMDQMDILIPCLTTLAWPRAIRVTTRLAWSAPFIKTPAKLLGARPIHIQRAEAFCTCCARCWAMKFFIRASMRTWPNLGFPPRKQVILGSPLSRPAGLAWSGSLINGAFVRVAPIFPPRQPTTRPRAC